MHNQLRKSLPIYKTMMCSDSSVNSLALYRKNWVNNIYCTLNSKLF